MAKTKLMSVHDDPAVVTAHERYTTVAGERDAATQALNGLRPEGRGGATPVTMAVLVAQARLSELDEQLTAAERALATAQAAARERIVASAAPARIAARRRLLDAIETVVAAGRVVAQEDATVAHALGVAPGPHPVPGLSVVAVQATQLRRELDPPPAEGLMPQRRGTRRLRVIADDGLHFDLHYFSPGCVFDFPDDAAKELLRRKLAEEVLTV